MLWRDFMEGETRIFIAREIGWELVIEKLQSSMVNDTTKLLLLLLFFNR